MIFFIFLKTKETKGCVVGRNNIDEINKSAKIIYTKIVVISQAHRGTKIETNNKNLYKLLIN